jgi:hypothetical protein
MSARSYDGAASGPKPLRAGAQYARMNVINTWDGRKREDV